MEREIAGYDVTEIENFVVKRSDQYLERFERLAQNKRPKFNWAAALFDGLWLGYRKMWIESLVYYVIYYTTCNLIISAIGVCQVKCVNSFYTSFRNLVRYRVLTEIPVMVETCL